MISKQEKIFTGISKLVAIESTSIAKHVENFLGKEDIMSMELEKTRLLSKMQETVNEKLEERLSISTQVKI